METTSPAPAPCDLGIATLRSALRKARRPGGTRPGGRLFLECSFAAPTMQLRPPPTKPLPEETNFRLVAPRSSADPVSCVVDESRVRSTKKTPVCLRTLPLQPARDDWCRARFPSTPPSCPTRPAK